MVDGWTSWGVSSTFWVVLNSLLVTGHESRGGYCTGYGLRPIGPWPEHSQGPKLSPNLIVSPYRFWVCDRQAHVWPFMICLGVRLLKTTYFSSGSVLPWGVLLPGDLLEAEISSNATTTISNGIYSMSRIITLDPTHIRETRM